MLGGYAGLNYNERMHPKVSATDPPLTGESLRQVVAQIRDFLGGIDEK